MKKYILPILIGALAAAALLGPSSPRPADAQGAPAQLLVTWQADTYVPNGFAGKALPASDSLITVGVDLIDLGKRVDLSPYKVFWYVDEKFQQGGVGLSRIAFKAPHFIGQNSVRVRVVITDYGSAPGRTITIPIVPPEVVIQSSAPSLAASAVPFTLQAYPYFFNIQDPSELSFGWSLNGFNASSQRSLLITEEMAERSRPARAVLTVRNPNRPIERLTQELTVLK